jgi:membrane-bound ClpP family serine protease
MSDGEGKGQGSGGPGGYQLKPGESGHVWAAGERWRASAGRDLAVGDPVRVRRVDGLTLVVEPASGSGAGTNQERREGAP